MVNARRATALNLKTVNTLSFQRMRMFSTEDKKPETEEEVPKQEEEPQIKQESVKQPPPQSGGSMMPLFAGLGLLGAGFVFSQMGGSSEETKQSDKTE